MKISIVIPCYNESKTINNVYEKVSNFKNLEKEIIIIDDCSTDGSRKIIEKIAESDPNVKVIFKDQNQGKGSALKEGFKLVKMFVIIVNILFAR